MTKTIKDQAAALLTRRRQLLNGVARIDGQIVGLKAQRSDMKVEIVRIDQRLNKLAVENNEG